MSNTIPPPGASPWLSVLLIIAGCVLLLPGGLCAAVLAIKGIGALSEGALLVGTVICIAIAVGGIFMIRAGIRRRRR